MPELTSDREVMDVIQAAAFIGVNHRTVRRWITDRDLPHVRVGQVLRFRRSALLEWLKAQETATMASRPRGSRKE